MKNSKSVYRLIVMALVAFVAIIAPDAASAKWSKACSSFTYDGVKVSVVDRREFIGHPIDSYGYINMENTNPYDVTIKWECYGVTRKGTKLVKVDEGEFELPAHKTSKPMYSYIGGYFFEKDFQEYVVSIEVHKGEVTKLAALHARIMRHSEDGELTQQDFADGIQVWREYYFNHMLPLVKSRVRDKKAGMSEADLEKKYAKTDDQLSDYEKQSEDIMHVVSQSANIDLLDEKNMKALEKLWKDIEDYIMSDSDLKKEFEMSGY